MSAASKTPKKAASSRENIKLAPKKPFKNLATSRATAAGESLDTKSTARAAARSAGARSWAALT
jgi:hypothetical protein